MRRFAVEMARKLTRAEIDALVVERDYYRSVPNYAKSDEILTLLKNENVEVTDVSYKSGKNSTWVFVNEEIVPVETKLMDLAHTSFMMIQSGAETELSIANKAKALLKLQLYGFESSATTKVVDFEKTTFIVSQKSSEMTGRKYADAAFEFCMAGITDPELFSSLAECTRIELLRFGGRGSCRSLPILQMVEKLAVSGVRDHEVFHTAKILLRNKSERQNMHGIEDNYSLFSPRPLLWLWRYATKQKKPTKTSKQNEADDERGTIDVDLQQLHIGAEENETKTDLVMPTSELPTYIPAETSFPCFADLFQDPTLPLVLDLGCGYGVPLMNLSDQQQRGQHTRRCNYLGVDLSARAIRYATGISQRWGMGGTCAFVYADCVKALEHIRDAYPGPVVFTMVNFPTPYGVSAVLTDSPVVGVGVEGTDSMNKDTQRARSASQGSEEVEDPTRAGNSQLPDSFRNFMFNAELAALIRAVMSKASVDGVAPVLFLQSNVEDVVVTMSNIVRHQNNDPDLDTERLKQFGVPEPTALQANLDDLFLSRNANNNEAVPWRSLAELQFATSAVPGAGRMSRRLQLWLDELNHLPVSVVDDGKSAALLPVVTLKHEEESVVARKRAAGRGWLARSPLPGNARTETEVHCELEKQPVHRIMFTLE